MAWTDWSIVQRRPLKRNWSFLLGVRSTRDLQSAAFRDESGWETVKNREKCLAMIGFCRNRHWQDLIPWSVQACIFLLYIVVTKSEPNPLSHSLSCSLFCKNGFVFRKNGWSAESRGSCNFHGISILYR